MWIHTVVAGESLRDIAERYGASTRDVARLNELENENILVPGLHLLLPGPAVGVQPVRIRPGDTLTTLSRRTGISLGRLESWTGLREGQQPQAGQPTQELIAGQTLYLPREIPADQKMTIEVNGYLLPTGSVNDANNLRETQAMTYVCMFSYQARADGTVAAPKDTQGLQAARQLNIAPLMTVTNFDGNNFNTELAHSILANGSIRRKLIDEVVRILRQKGFHGVNVDFEHMRPGDRPLYNAFIRELARSVRAQGHSISIAMGPKTRDEPEASWMGAFDYRTLGAEVDFLMLMTYEWGWVGGPPMAIAPLDQVRAVLDYAVSVMPSDKILMGMALYGYDWPLPYPSGRRASGISNNSAQNLAIAKESPIQWNAAAQSPSFRYRDAEGVDHEVWFEDALSALIKFELIRELRLRGISWWVLGQEFPQGWRLMSDTFNVKKL